MSIENPSGMPGPERQSSTVSGGPSAFTRYSHGDMEEVLDTSRESAGGAPAVDPFKASADRRASLQRMAEDLNRESQETDLDKGQGSSATQKVSNTFGKGWGKMKGLFKKQPKDDMVQMPRSFEDDDEAPPTRMDPHPGSYDMNPSSTLSQDASKMDSFSASVRGLFTPAPVTLPPPDVHKKNAYGEDIAVMKDQPPKEPIRMSTILTVLLALMFIAGIIMSACSGLDDTLKILGPLFIVLPLFALCGKAFFTLLFEDEPFPRLRPYITRMEEFCKCDKDPYGLESGEAYKQTTHKSTYPVMVEPAATMSTVPVYSGTQPPPPGGVTFPVQSSVYASGDPVYPQRSGASTPDRPPPISYDQNIDTRLRTGSREGSRAGSEAGSAAGSVHGSRHDISGYPEGRSTPY